MNLEQKAIKIAMEYERSRGKEPRDVSREGCGYDVKSGDSCIKVKGITSKKSPQWVWVDIRGLLNHKSAEDCSNCYVYAVYSVNKNPKLKINSIYLGNFKVDLRQSSVIKCPKL